MTATKTKSRKPPTTLYAEDVIAGKLPAGRMVHAACERHLRDLKDGAARGLRFDATKAAKAIRFFSFLKHTKGEWAGETFALEPWQKFIIGCLFGWMGADGTRRFRIAYIEVPRKNGKSTLAAGVGLLLLTADDEPGAEIYTAATKRDQARIVHGEAVNMVKKSPSLRGRVGIFKDNLHVEATGSKYEPLGADADTLDGLNTHGSIIDELHAHRNRRVVDVLETATSARRQPLQFEITTAGFDRHSICWEHHDYGTRILEGVIEDDTWFVYIASMDSCNEHRRGGKPDPVEGCMECDSWRDPNVWAKANPNFGISVKADDLKRKCLKAVEVPAAQNAFRRLHLDEWTEQATRWLDMGVWRECTGQVDERALEGRMCYGGLDLASTTDICALELVFPALDEEEPVQVLSFFWVPEDNVMARAERDRVPYDLWARQGDLMTTEGNVTDYDVIRRDVLDLAKRYNIRELAIDRWNSTQLQAQLVGEGVTVVPFGMGFVSMTAPTKELERLVLQRGIAHGGNPVLNWAASNVAVRQDAAGNIKPDKENSTEKIDPITALIMAIGRMIVSDGSDGTSVYETRGVVTV